MGDSVSLKYLAALNLFSPEFSPSLERSPPLPLPPAFCSTIAAHPQVYKCAQPVGFPGASVILAVILLKFFCSGLFRFYTMLVTIVSVQAPCSPPGDTPAPLSGCPRLLAPRVQRGARGGRVFSVHLAGRWCSRGKRRCVAL